MPLLDMDDPAVMTAMAIGMMTILLLLAWQLVEGATTELMWQSRVRNSLERLGFRVRHMERRWFTKGPFPDLRIGRSLNKEWLIRISADDAQNRPREGWVRWQGRHLWQKADTWAVRWDDQPALATQETQRTGTPSWLFYALAFLGAITVLLSAWAAFPGATDDVLVRSRATYAALKSYADSGTIDYEFGPATAPLRERYTFKTAYRAPRHFLFDFSKGIPAGRFVVWGDGEAFHTWWSATGIHDTHPRGSGARAFVLSSQPTAGSSVLISPLLFQGAGLVGTLEELRDVSEEGTEMIGGRSHHRLAGIARTRYQSGNETNVRRTVIWIDAETLLIRRVFEDTPQGTVASSVSRITTTFEPVANPALDDGRFRFVVPGGATHASPRPK
jgi:outer membrane lipoprotein-sorting protein